MKPVVTVLKAAILLLALALVAPASGWAQSEEQQSLGDIARKQKEKKGQEEGKGKKVLTNEDLPPGSETSASSSASAEGEAAGDAASAEADKGAAAQGEPSGLTGAQQADEAKKKAEALQHDEAATEKGIRRYEEMLANETDPSRRELYQRALRNAQGNLAVVQKNRADAEKEAAAKEGAAKEEQPPQ
jgi:hypothetical protein